MLSQRFLSVWLILFSFCFRELVPYPEESTGSHLIANGSDPVITNIYNSFKTCMATFQNQTKVYTTSQHYSSRIVVMRNYT